MRDLLTDQPTEAATDVSTRRLRVAMWPADSPGLSNPYTALLARGLRSEGVVVDELRWGALLRERYDIVHVHWPERMIDGANMRRRAGMVAALGAAARNGARIVWTVHNLGSHEALRSRPKAWAWRAFTGLVDGFVALTPNGVRAARAKFPGLVHTPAFVVPHGHYEGVYPEPPSRMHARRILDLSDATEVLLTFGMFRRYKGMARLIRTFREWPDDRAVLMLAGAPQDRTLAHELRELATGDRRVRLLDHSIDDQTSARLFAAADSVVLPYLDVLNSGVAMLGLSFHRPVIGPDKGAFPELQAQLGEAWVRTFEEPLDIDRLMHAQKDPQLPSEAQRCDLSSFGWDAITAATVDAYCSVLARPA